MATVSTAHRRMCRAREQSPVEEESTAKSEWLPRTIDRTVGRLMRMVRRELPPVPWRTRLLCSATPGSNFEGWIIAASPVWLGGRGDPAMDLIATDVRRRPSPGKREPIMDEARFDRLARLFGHRPASRRTLVVGLASGGLAVLGAGNQVEGKQRCKKRKRCGKDCCRRSSCFAKRIDPIDTTKVTYGCCPASKFCEAKSGRSADDECCYPDEVCVGRPSDSSSNSICCRECGKDAAGKRICCASSEVCRNGVCAPLNTARLPRRRR